MAGGLVLRNNGGDSLTVQKNGKFTFATKLEEDAAYAVTVSAQPAGQLCDVSGGKGTIGDADVASVKVDCISAPALKAFTEMMYLDVEWTAAGEVDILYSSDPECDWDNYSVCPGGTLVTSQPASGSLRLEARADGLTPERGWYFVARHRGLYSAVRGARAAPSGFTGSVRSMAAHSDTLYVGGTFTGVGTALGTAVTLDPDTGRFVGSTPFVDNSVWAITPDGHGGWYIGGDFETVGGEALSGLARIHANGAVDPEFQPIVKSRVEALVYHDGVVYAEGLFTTTSGTDRTGLMALDAATGAVIDSWTTGLDEARVRSFAVGDGVLFAGGRFQAADETSLHPGVRAFDLATGQALSWHQPTDSPVTALAVAHDVVYIGGEFTEVDGVPRPGIAAIDAETGVLRSWIAQVPDAGGIRAIVPGEGVVHAAGWAVGTYAMSDGALLASASIDHGLFSSLTMIGDTLYAAGNFGAVDGEPRNGVAAFDADSLALLSWNPKTAEFGNRLVASNGLLMVGVTGVIHQHVPRRNLAAFDLSTGFLSEWQPVVSGGGGGVFALATDGSHVFVGGLFSEANDEPVQNLVAFDAVTGELDAWNPQPSGGWIDEMAIHQGNLFVAGNFSHIASATRQRVAAFDVATRSLRAWDAGPIDGPITAMGFIDDRMYIAGDFSTAGAEPRDGLAAFDVATGALDMTWDPGSGGGASAMAASGTRVYVRASDWLAFDPVTGAVDTDWQPPAPSHSVSRLLVADGAVFARGAFSDIGGHERKWLARLDGSNGAVTPWNPALEGSMAPSAFLAVGDLLFVAGSSFRVGGRWWRGLAGIDMTTGELEW